MTIVSVEDKKVVKDAVIEISYSMTRIENERQQIKDIVDSISEKFDIPKPLIKKMAKIYHKDTLKDEQVDFDEFITLYEEVIAPTIIAE